MPRKPRRDCRDNPFEKGDHAVDLRRLAVESIETFFKSKSFYCGGPIPKHDLLSEHSVKTLLRTQLDDRCLDFIHERCLPLIPADPNYSDNTVTWQVHSLLGLLRELAALHLPKDYFGGLLLLYFKFCYGVEIIDPPLL